MLVKAEFTKRFIARMIEIVGKTEYYFEMTAEAAYDVYEDDPDDMTPEEHAEEEISEWGR